MDGKLNLHPKVAATTFATWITVIVVYSLSQWAHINLPTVVGVALTGVVAIAVGWLAPSEFTSDPTPSAAAVVPTSLTPAP